jgi:rare lipoprotein A
VEVEAILFKDALPSQSQTAMEPPDAAATLQATADSRGIFLQLGAFSSDANASSFRDKIQPQLAEQQLSAATLVRNKLHRVQVGPFKTRTEANHTAEKLRDTLGIRPVVVVR